MDTIPLGKHNPRLVGIRKAIQRGALTEEGLLPIEGPQLIGEALQSGLAVPAVFYRDDIALPEEWHGLSSYSLTPALFKTIQSTEHSQGIIALASLRVWKLADLIGAAASGPLVVLAGLQDPGNVGTILRVAEAFGAAGCIALPGTCSIHNSKVVRASAGSVFRLPHVWDVDLDSAATAIRSASISLVGTSPHAKTPITSWDWRKPTALLIGNEGNGLSPEHMAVCATSLRIPQQTSMESLNSAIATSVILYEAWRGRNHV